MTPVFLATLWLLGCGQEDPGPMMGGGTDTAPECTPAEDCCRVCTESQACGDACISNDNECSQEPGCACDAVDVCPEGDSGSSGD